MLGANAAPYVPESGAFGPCGAGERIRQSGSQPEDLMQDLMQGILLSAGTKGTAKTLEEIQLLEERGAALAAEADEAEALHSSAGDPMTR